MPPRFSMGRITGGLLAGLCFWGAVSVILPTAGQAAPSTQTHKRSARSSPTPSAAPSASPAASGDNGSASPSGDNASDAAATPSGSPSPAFVQKYEAATVQFLQKDYDGARKLLDEADAIQPHQPNSVSLRNQIFKQYYEAAYLAYQHADYATALTQLDGADATGTNPQNQSDAYNLRGLVLSKQRNYEGAENMFRKAVQTDPGLWAAKFNYAEVPFNYRNFTVARTRFEELFSQTDPAKQPVEAELTQFKVFLTLLLEGKEDAARTFMQHFNFSGATPARYFCQAALNFYSGDVDKAQGWIDSARKEYPPRKSSSFLEAFYRVGWLTDPNMASPSTSGPAVASSAPSVPPASSSSASPTPETTLAAAVATVASASTLPSATPMVVAAASPAATPAFRTAVPLPSAAVSSPVAESTLSTPAAKTSVTAPVAPAVVASTPSPTASRAPVAAAATPSPSPTAVPAIAAFTPSGTPRASVSPPAETTPGAETTASTPAPEAATPAPVAEAASSGDSLRTLIVGAVALYFLYVVARIVWTASNRKPRTPVRRELSSQDNRARAEADQVETPR